MCRGAEKHAPLASTLISAQHVSHEVLVDAPLRMQVAARSRNKQAGQLIVEAMLEHLAMARLPTSFAEVTRTLMSTNTRPPTHTQRSSLRSLKAVVQAASSISLTSDVLSDRMPSIMDQSVSCVNARVVRASS